MVNIFLLSYRLFLLFLNSLFLFLFNPSYSELGIKGLLTPDAIKEIGTIRRYGLAADYMITIGAAKAELSGDDRGDVNGKEVSRLLRLASGSIDEISSILQSMK